MRVRVWNEGGQRFTYEGACIRTLKPGILKLAYGDERLREIREQRESEKHAPIGLLRRVLSGILPGTTSDPT